MKTNNIHHKDCPLTDKRKLRMILHGEYCSQFINNDVRAGKESAKFLPIDPMRTPYCRSQNELFINICATCSKNVMWGYSGYSGHECEFGQSGNRIHLVDKPGFFQKIWNIIKILWN